MKAIIPAAGKGSRLMPISLAIPKELLPVVDKLAIDYVLSEVLQNGINEIILIISKEKEIVRAYLEKQYPKSNSYEIKYIYQECLDGLGGAIELGKNDLSDEKFFCVVLPDNLFPESDNNVLKELISINSEFKIPCISVEELIPLETMLRGVIKADIQQPQSFGIIEDLIEKPNKILNGYQYSITGRYILPGSVFKVLSEQKKNGNGYEFDLTIALKELISKKNLIGYLQKERRFDIGSFKGYFETVFSFGKGRSDFNNILGNYTVH